MRKHTKYHHISGNSPIRCYLIALVLSLAFTVGPIIASPEQPGLVISPTTIH